MKTNALRSLLLAPLLLLLQTSFAAAGPDLIRMAAEGDSFRPDFVQSLAAVPLEEINQAHDGDGRTMLHWLAARSHQARILVPLLRGADVNVKDQRGRTPLFDNLEAHDPGYRGEADFMILEMLTACGADLNVRAPDGTTPLAIAVQKGDYRKAEFLLWCGAELNPAGVPPGKLPMAIASARGDQRMVSLLQAAAKMDAGAAGSAAPDNATKSRKRPLADALTAADLNAVEERLASGWKIDEQDEKGRTALFRAVETGRADLASLLIFEGADPNIPTKTGKTPLMASVQLLTIEGQRTSALLLLKGADLNAVAKNGSTALVNAVSSGNDFGVLWLLCRGADAFAPTPKGSLMEYAEHPPTAWVLKQFGLLPVEKAPVTNPAGIMIEAVKHYDLEGVRRALDAGVPPDAVYQYQRTALDWAVSYGEFDVIDLLLERGANINRQYKSGYHPLHHLATWGGAGGGDAKVAGDYIEKLIQRGANPNIAMKDGMTPLMMAAKDGVMGPNTEALLKAGAQINARNKSGLTPLGIARKFGRTAMTEFLKNRGALE